MPTDLPPAPRPPSAWADRPVAAARSGLLALAAFVPLAALGGLLGAGREGVVGALLGCLVPASVLLLTWGAAELGARRSAQAFAGLLLGSYLVKLVVVLALLAVLRQATEEGGSADPTAMGVAAIAGLMVALVVEAVVITRTRAPYVEP